MPQSLSFLLAHVVLSTKDRTPVLGKIKPYKGTSHLSHPHDPRNLIILHAGNLCVLCALCAILFPPPAMDPRQGRRSHQGLERRSLIHPSIIQFLLNGKRPLPHDPRNLIILHAGNLCVLCVLCAILFPRPAMDPRQSRQSLERRSLIHPIIIQFLLHGKRPLPNDPRNLIILHAGNLCVLCALCAILVPRLAMDPRQARPGSGFDYFRRKSSPAVHYPILACRSSRSRSKSSVSTFARRAPKRLLAPAAMAYFQSVTSIGWVDILADFLDRLDTLEHLKRPAGCAFGFVSSSFGFHFVWVRLGSRPAPDHHHQSGTPGPNFGVRLTVPPPLKPLQ